MKKQEKVTQADLDQLRALQYKTSCLERLLEERCDLEDDFHQHLLALAIPNAVVYNDIMQRFEGDPSGVEFKSKSGTQWAFVLPDASEPGRHRIQYFDERSFFSHHSYSIVADAVKAMISEGYCEEDAGALDRNQTTETWRKGTAVAALKMQLDRGKLSWTEFIALAEAA